MCVDFSLGTLCRHCVRLGMALWHGGAGSRQRCAQRGASHMCAAWPLTRQVSVPENPKGSGGCGEGEAVLRFGAGGVPANGKLKGDQLCRRINGSLQASRRPLDRRFCGPLLRFRHGGSAWEQSQEAGARVWGAVQRGDEGRLEEPLGAETGNDKRPGRARVEADGWQCRLSERRRWAEELGLGTQPAGRSLQKQFPNKWKRRLETVYGEFPGAVVA